MVLEAGLVVGRAPQSLHRGSRVASALAPLRAGALSAKAESHPRGGLASSLRAAAALLIPGISRRLLRRPAAVRHQRRASLGLMAIESAAEADALAADEARFCVRLPADGEEGNLELVSRLVDLVNEAYRFGEDGMWTEGFKRTSPDEVAGLLKSKTILLLEDTAACPPE
ncbi:unnamed protein product, partial [Polarella glacialis]